MSRVCLITGGTQGIGKATANSSRLKDGKSSFPDAIPRRGKAIPKVVDEITAAGGEATFITADVSTQASVKKLHDEAVAAYGQLDGAVNNAGISTDNAKLGDASTEAFQDMVQVNVFGLFWCMQEQIRLMLPNKAGHIVNLASIAGLHGIPLNGTYCATKHAVVAMTRAAALDYARDGLRIAAVAPGAIRTDILNYAIQSGAFNEESIAGLHPVNKLGETEDISRAISFLLNSPFVTGSVLEVDGGVGAS